jgi:diguanylate cyclase (GGDEF)-like protein
LLAEERRFALDMSSPFCLCLVDIDQLRKINEQSGLGAGDAVLAGTTETVRSVLDQPGWHHLRVLMGRYDGDSLILLMPGCRLEESEKFAHVLKQRITESVAAYANVTASLAITAFKGDDTIDELLARIEKTMCLAKQFGGDSVEVMRTPELTRDLASVTRLPVVWHGDKPAKSA